MINLKQLCSQDRFKHLFHGRNRICTGCSENFNGLKHFVDATCSLRRVLGHVIETAVAPKNLCGLELINSAIGTNARL
ncbi:hypothetical protein D3C84_1109870 [compost metagenome]